MIDLDEIERLARGIHPRWHLDGDGLRTMIRDNATGVILAVRHRAPREQHEAVMAYMIAVEPATILALVARLRAAEAALREIVLQHIGDCPASLAHLTDEEWARRCHGHLRMIALAAYRALTEEPTP